MTKKSETHIALTLFLILVTIGIIVFISVIIIIKRRISNRKSRVDLDTFTPCGHRLPKIHKERIERGLNGTIQVRTQPRVFGPFYADGFATHLKDGKFTFLYRAKCLDEFLDLKRDILTVASDLDAPPLVDVKPFLLTARRRAMVPPASKETIEEYCQLYLMARHDLDTFSEEEYKRSHHLQQKLLSLVSPVSDPRSSTRSDGSHGRLTRCHSAKLFQSLRVPRKSLDAVEANAKGSASFFRRISRTSVPSTNLSLKRLKQPRTWVQGLNTGIGGDVIQNKNPTFDDRTAGDNRTNDSLARRGSLRSDGSQISLLDFDPVVVTSRSSRQKRSTESREQLEMKNLFLRSKGASTTSASSSSAAMGGVANEGVNC